MASSRKPWVLIDCILVEINKTKITTFDLKRKWCTTKQFTSILKYLAESLDILKIRETWKVELFCPLNSYILHSHGECGLFTLYLKEIVLKIQKMENIEFYTCTL